jgi:Arylsulfotransferase (ASST)
MRLSLFAALLVSVPVPAQTLGLTGFDPNNQDGYVLFAPIPSTTTYLIDKCGRAVHTWPSAYKPGQAVYLLDDGALLRSGAVMNATFNAGGRGGKIERIAWDGTVEWSYTISDATQCSHHDIHPMPNGNVLVIVWETHTTAEAIAKGRDPALLGNSLWCERIVELQPTGLNGANIVWEWRLWDHLVQDFDATKPGYGVVADHPELLHLNFVPGNPVADWVHMNALDYNVELDQVIMSSHNLSEVWVIDHSTSTAEAATHAGGAHGHGGDFLYRWGNPQVYDRGAALDQVYFGQHNVQWIRDGLPRAGEILVFNNGLGRPAGAYSTIDVFAPADDGNGNYIAGAGPFGPTGLDYSWSADPPTSFYGMNISGAQALPNGGFMACSGPSGTFVEVDANGDEVWRYVSPVNINGPMTQGATPTGNTVFRCTWLAPGHPGLVGHDLTPGAQIELQPVTNACITLTVNGTPIADDRWTIAPVPASDHIRLSGSTAGSSIALIDMQGTAISEWNAGGGVVELDVASVPNGFYLLRSTLAADVRFGKVSILH